MRLAAGRVVEACVAAVARAAKAAGVGLQLVSMVLRRTCARTAERRVSGVRDGIVWGGIGDGEEGRGVVEVRVKCLKWRVARDRRKCKGLFVSVCQS